MISLVLATYNRSEELKIFFNSVIDSTIQFEIIIVDQNDKINIEPIISEYRKKGIDIVHIKESEKNLSKARNIGINHSKYKIIGFPDDDCYYEADTLDKVLSVFKSESTDILIARWVEHSYNYAKNPKHLSSKDILRFNTCPLSSITIFVLKSVLKDLSGFDIRLGVGQWFGSGEETDLIMRASINKYRIYYSPHIRVHHKFILHNIGNKIDKDFYLNRSRGTGAIYSKNKLAIDVVLRGFFAPLIKGFLSFKRTPLLNNLYVFWGRLSGFIRWNNKKQ